MPIKKPKVRPIKNGFTLVEILVVIVIVAILSGLGLRSFTTSQVKARDSRRRADLDNIAKSLEAYYNDKGQYPTATSGLIDGCANETSCQWGEIWEDENDTIYMVLLPSDPSEGRKYYYDSDGTYFQLYARYENVLNADVAPSGGNPQVYTDTDCGTSASIECNYGIASTNTLPSANHPREDE